MRSLRWAGLAALIGFGLVAMPVRAASTEKFTASLRWDEEVDSQGNPAHGPMNGTGSAVVEIDRAMDEICYTLTWSREVNDTGTPNAAHIHRGPKGANGPIVLALDQAGNVPTQRTCISGLGPVLDGIADDPGGHYVNIHNNTYLNGAIRGQLSKMG